MPICSPYFKLSIGNGLASIHFWYLKPGNAFFSTCSVALTVVAKTITLAKIYPDEKTYYAACAGFFIGRAWPGSGAGKKYQPQHYRKLTNPNGNGLTITYTDSLISTISSTAVQMLSFSYTGGRLSAITDALASPARTFTYQYDNVGNLIKVTDPLDGLVQYRYLTNGPMSGITDQNMNEVDIIYFPDFFGERTHWLQ